MTQCWHNPIAEAAHGLFGMNPFPYTPMAECEHMVGDPSSDCSCKEPRGRRRI